MNPTGATAKPVGWVFLDVGYTIRWRRGDPVAHALRGNQMDNHGMAGVVDTISVLPSGWTDLAQIRQVGQRWVRQQRERRGA
ncbi:MAG: hypothetical protein GEU83_19020 [Pseudonocardiaceae bacterium]|nr:hypothetical protein [Pseudonocardiaceae bacterium]